MPKNPYIYILIMAAVTYLIRALPLALLRKKITNKFFKSFLYYVPFVTLSVMTFPAILYSTGSVYSATIGFIIALVTAYISGSLPIVAVTACLSVLIAEWII